MAKKSTTVAQETDMSHTETVTTTAAVEVEAKLVEVATPEPQLPMKREEPAILVPSWAKGKNLPAGAPDYAMMVQDRAMLQELIQANLGNQRLDIFNLQFIRVPSGAGVPPSGPVLWTIQSIEGTEMKEEFEGIIVSWFQPRSYWATQFEQRQGASPPDCKSNDGLVGVGNPGGDCMTCKFAQFKSAAKGDGQACRQSRFLFVMMPGSYVPCVVRAPVTSIKAIQQYFTQSIGLGMTYFHCVTKFRLERDKNAGGTVYAKIAPTMARKLNEDEIIKTAHYMRMFQPLLQTVEQDPHMFDEE